MTYVGSDIKAIALLKSSLYLLRDSFAQRLLHINPIQHQGLQLKQYYIYLVYRSFHPSKQRKNLTYFV